MLLHDPPLVAPLQDHRERVGGRHVVAGRGALGGLVDARIGVEDAGDLRG